MTKHLLSNWSQSPYAFGGAAISGEGGGYGFGQPKDNAEELLEYAFENGIRVFDTAPIYGFGKSEEILGEYFKKNRDQVKIISKSGVYWHENQRVDMTNDPKITEKMLEDSLRRLQSDYIDLYMIHWPDAQVDIRRPMEVLAKAKNRGKIKHIGLCNTHILDYQAASEIEKIEVIQSEHNIFNSPPEDIKEIILKDNLSFMGWGTFDKGILTGRVTKKREQAKDYDKDDCRKSAPWWSQKEVLAKCEKVEKLEDFIKSISSQNKGVSNLTELSLRYLFSKTWHSVTLMGAKSKKDWEEVLEVSTEPLEETWIQEINRICH
ncbi:MAG: hypothetical protein CME63_02450 [Halobacteriovoraceae bacterium]|nr:hypothetical protein [Halobacteriovoraceae bacterium]